MKEQHISFETAKLAKEKGFMWKHVTFRKMTPGELADPDNEQVIRMGIKEAPVWEGDIETERGGTPCYNAEGMEIWPNKYSPRNPHYPRPTQSLLNRWLREKHEIHVATGAIASDKWIYGVQANDWEIEYDLDNIYTTHEAAMEAGLQEALKLIKNEQL